jgi:hypothetical protein
MRFQLFPISRVRDSDISSSSWLAELKLRHEHEFSEQAESLWSALKCGSVDAARTARFCHRLRKLRNECSSRFISEYEAWQISARGGQSRRLSREDGKEKIRPRTADTARETNGFIPIPVADFKQTPKSRRSSHRPNVGHATAQPPHIPRVKRTSLLTPPLEKPIDERTLPILPSDQHPVDSSPVPIIDVVAVSPRKRSGTGVVSDGGSPTITPKKPKDASTMEPISRTPYIAPSFPPLPTPTLPLLPTMGNSPSQPKASPLPSPLPSPSLIPGNSPDIRNHLDADGKYSVPRALQYWEIDKERERRIEAMQKARASQENSPALTTASSKSPAAKLKAPLSPEPASLRPSPASGWSSFSGTPGWDSRATLPADGFNDSSDDEEEMNLKRAALSPPRPSPYPSPRHSATDVLFGPSPVPSPKVEHASLPRKERALPPPSQPPSLVFPVQAFKAPSRPPPGPPPTAPAPRSRKGSNVGVPGSARAGVNFLDPLSSEKPSRGHKRTISSPSIPQQAPSRTPRPERTPYLSPSMIPHESRAGYSPHPRLPDFASSASAAAWSTMVKTAS